MPKLSASIDRIILNKGGNDPNGQHSDILLVVTIRNSGLDSFIEWQDLTVQIGKDKPIETEGTLIPDRLRVHNVGLNDSVDYFGKDALYKKTTDTPLTRGAMKRGLLLYRIKNVRIEALAQTGTKFHLTYSDVLEKQHSADYIWPAQTTSAYGYLPGIDMDYHEPPKPSKP